MQTDLFSSTSNIELIEFDYTLSFAVDVLPLLCYVYSYEWLQIRRMYAISYIAWLQICLQNYFAGVG